MIDDAETLVIVASWVIGAISIAAFVIMAGIALMKWAGVF